MNRTSSSSNILKPNGPRMSEQDSTGSRAKIPNPPDPQEVTTHPRHVSSRRDKEKEIKRERKREYVYVCTKRQLSSKWHSLGSTSMLRFSLRAIARKQRARARGVEKKLDGRSVESLGGKGKGG